MNRTAGRQDSTIAAVLAGEARWCVIEGDCLDVMAGMSDGCVDHVITDPPYSEHTHRSARTGGNGSVRDLDIGFAALDRATLERAADEFARLPRRWCAVFTAVEQAQLWASELSVNALEYVRTGAWVRLATTPQFTGDRPAQGHEEIVFCHRKGRKKWNGGGRPAVYQHEIVRGARLHKTEKPLPLMLEILGDFTDPDDLILDPFCGAGTTGVAALKLGRRAILIEKDPKYAEIARQRMLDTEEEIAAEGGEVRTYSKPRQAGLFSGGNK